MLVVFLGLVSLSIFVPSVRFLPAVSRDIVNNVLDERRPEIDFCVW